MNGDTPGLTVLLTTVVTYSRFKLQGGISASLTLVCNFKIITNLRDHYVSQILLLQIKPLWQFKLGTEGRLLCTSLYIRQVTSCVIMCYNCVIMCYNCVHTIIISLQWLAIIFPINHRYPSCLWILLFVHMHDDSYITLNV